MSTCDRDENNSDRSQVIPPAEPNRLTSDRHAFRPACLQTGVTVNTNIFQTGLGCNLDIGTTHGNKSHLKKKIAWQGK
jgi:hypothetical protein